MVVQELSSTLKLQSRFDDGKTVRRNFSNGLVYSVEVGEDNLAPTRLSTSYSASFRTTRTALFLNSFTRKESTWRAPSTSSQTTPPALQQELNNMRNNGSTETNKRGYSTSRVRHSERPGVSIGLQATSSLDTSGVYWGSKATESCAGNTVVEKPGVNHPLRHGEAVERPRV